MREINNENLIRKLSRYEVMYDNEAQLNNLVLTRAFLFNLSKGEITLDLLKVACTNWTRRHPFLGAEVYRTENDLERYYSRMDEETLLKFENVGLIETNKRSKWLDVIDKEIITDYDTSKGPLWRLKIIRLVGSNNTRLNYNHVLVFSCQHTIGDGRNLYEVCIELFNIIGALIENKQCEEMNEISQCSFFSSEDLIREKSIVIAREKDETFDNQSRIPKCFVNKFDDSYAKFQFFNIDSSRFKKLMLAKKLNTKNSKLTSILNGLICLALRNLYEKNKVDDIPVDLMQFLVLASYREKLGLKNNQMGVYSSELKMSMNMAEMDLNEINLESDFSTFWYACDKNSMLLDEKLKSNLDMKFIYEIEKSIEEMKLGKFNEDNINFTLSNIGNMKNTNTDVIKIKEHYLRMPSMKNRSGSSLFISVSTVEDKLCMGFSYNEKTISSKMVHELIKEINRLIEKITAF